MATSALKVNERRMESRKRVSRFIIYPRTAITSMSEKIITRTKS